MRKTKNQVDRYLQQALSPNTLSAYASDLRHFKAWGGRIPSTPQTVARYLSDCASRMKASTLVRRLAAIRHAHVEAGRQSPTTAALVQRTLRGIRRVHGTAAKQAQPLSMSMLRQLLRPRADVHPLRDLRDRTLLALGFAGGFRRSELVGLRPCDLKLTGDGALVAVRRSKTDAFAQGRVVGVPRSKGAGCPVRLLIRWLSVLRQCEPEGYASPLFRSVGRYGTLGHKLTGPAVGEILRARMERCGLQAAAYSAHSLRAGLVTTAAVSGAPLWSIQRQTGHRSISSVHRYIRSTGLFEANAYSTAATRTGASRGAEGASFRVKVS